MEARKVYTSVLNSFKDRDEEDRDERSYSGDKLQTEIPPKATISPGVISIYHDECIYASHEGALTLWVPDHRDPTYKKPRGAVVMCPGFICRCHGMMKVYDNEIDDFLHWTSSRACETYMLSSFTTIVQGKGKDDYWDNNDMCSSI